MKVKRWKQVFIETFDGKVKAIEAQQYPLEAKNFDILSLRDKDGWYWYNDYTGWAKTNDSYVMRVHIMCDKQETWIDKIKKLLR